MLSETVVVQRRFRVILAKQSQVLCQKDADVVVAEARPDHENEVAVDLEVDQEGVEDVGPALKAEQAVPIEVVLDRDLVSDITDGDEKKLAIIEAALLASDKNLLFLYPIANGCSFGSTWFHT